MKLRIDVPALEPIPKWYGVAYRCLNRDASVCYLMPLNWLARWVRAAALALKVPPVERWMQDELRAEYKRGYLDGLRDARAS